MKTTLEELKKIIRSCVIIVRSALSQRRTNAILTATLCSQPVLILGSGLSAKNLQKIPSGIKILACNLSPNIFIKTNQEKAIDVYLCRKAATDSQKYGYELGKLFDQITIDIFITDDPAHFKKSYPNLRVKKYIFDHSIGRLPNGKMQTHYLKKVISKACLKELLTIKTKGLSAGMGLLLYAVNYNAKEIFMSGIDLDTRGYAFGDRQNTLYESAHQSADLLVLAELSKTKKMYVCSADSPLAKVLPVLNLNNN